MTLNNIFYSPLEQFDVKPLYFISIPILQIDLTLMEVFLPFILIIVYFLIFKLLNYSATFLPMPLQWIAENILEFVTNIIKKQLNPNAYRFIPLIFTLFFTILTLNLLSLVPFGLSLTSHLIISLWFSIGLGVTCFIKGFMHKGPNFFKIFVPSAPLALLPVLIIIELFSYLIRCFSLAIRLTANMLAGHTLIIIIVSFLLVILTVCLFFGFFTLMAMISVMMLELGVCFLQAYVLTILTCIYLNDIYADSH